MSVPVPNPTPIYRIMHVSNLQACLTQGALYAPNHTPPGAPPYQTIHNAGIQGARQVKAIQCGPGGTLHDYVPFYFGYLSPMLLQLKTGQVAGYNQGQAPIIYLVSTVQAVTASGAPFVFSDGHGIKAFTGWFDNLASLSNVDWNMVYQRYWADTVADPDRQRRKQAEFLVHQKCDWGLIAEIGVFDDEVKARVEAVLQRFPATMHRPVNVRRSAWYYHQGSG
jgi:hypothetical protein